MTSAESAKDNFLYTIAAEATEAYDEVCNAVDDDALETASVSLLRIEQVYSFYEEDNTERDHTRYIPYTTRRAMARVALLYAGVTEDAQQAADTIRLATTHSEAEIHLATGDLDSLGLVTIK